MKVSVFGLGYVGCVSAACLAQDGHTVVGVDVDSRKVASINAGHAPFVEPDLQEILQSAKASGLLSATTVEIDAVSATDMALVCVGTPSAKTGEIKLEYLRAVLTTIGESLRERTTPFVVIFEGAPFCHTLLREI